MLQRDNVRVLRSGGSGQTTDYSAWWIAGADAGYINITWRFVDLVHHDPIADLSCWLARGKLSSPTPSSLQRMTVGIGAGQMSRVDSAHRFHQSAERWSTWLTRRCFGCFLPFRDGLDVVVCRRARGDSAGWQRARRRSSPRSEYGIAMVFTGAFPALKALTALRISAWTCW